MKVLVHGGGRNRLKPELRLLESRLQAAPAHAAPLLLYAAILSGSFPLMLKGINENALEKFSALTLEQHLKEMLQVAPGASETFWFRALEVMEETLRGDDRIRNFFEKHPQQDCEDVVMIAAGKLAADDYRRLRSFQGKSKMETYLGQVALNQADDVIRRERAKIRGEGKTISLEASVSNDPQGATYGEMVEETWTIEKMLDYLHHHQWFEEWTNGRNTKDQELLQFLESGLKPKQIAEIQGCTRDAIDQRKFRLKKHLLEFLRRKGAGE